MKFIKALIIILLWGALILEAEMTVYAEERYEDVLASVVVGSTFQVSLDNSSVNFGEVKPGERIELYPDRSYNQVTCVSNLGKTWYLKMYARNDLVGSKGKFTIPKENLKWYVGWTNGSGGKKEGWNGFTDTPSLVYTSGPEDNGGEEIFLQLKYALDVPGGAAHDSYFTVVAYTLTESP